MISSISFSRLEDYLKCPRYFYEKHVAKDPLVTGGDKKEALLQGVLAHSIIERKLELNRDLDETELLVIVATWLIKTCQLPTTIDFQQMDLGEGIDLESLYACSLKISYLLDRAACWYEDEDKIRSKSGEVLADPLAYPSLSFRQALDKADVYQVQNVIDITATRLNDEYINASLVRACAKGLHFGRNFDLKENVETIGIEYDLIQNQIEAAPNIVWRGYIDWIYKDELGIHIRDHKTSKAAPSDVIITHHEQLNVYAYLYFLTTGQWVDTIGIDHLASKQEIAVPLDRELCAHLYNYYCDLTLEIADPNNKWHRQPPSNKYSSNCARQLGREVSVCKAIGKCWPKFNYLSV